VDSVDAEVVHTMTETGEKKKFTLTNLKKLLKYFFGQFS